MWPFRRKRIILVAHHKINPQELKLTINILKHLMTLGSASLVVVAAFIDKIAPLPHWAGHPETTRGEVQFSYFLLTAYLYCIVFSMGKAMILCWDLIFASKDSEGLIDLEKHRGSFKMVLVFFCIAILSFLGYAVFNIRPRFEALF